VSVDLGKLLQDAERRYGGSGAGAGGGLGGLFKAGPVAEQLLVWGVVNQLLGTVLAPPLAFVQRGVNSEMQATPLTPADLADMVVRHIVTMQEGTDYAKQSGIAPSDFGRLVESAGEGPAPGDLAEALRRGIIPATGTGPAATSYEQGLAESHLRDKWAAVTKALAVKEPSPGDALDALLKGQLDHDTALGLYERFGGDPAHFSWLFDAQGSAPTPLEASEMANRRIIPWDGQGPDVVSYEQAFLEGPWRDKWSGPYRRLAEYKPPARTIVALVRSGAATDQQALQWFQDLGMSQELAAAQLADAHHQRLQASKELAKGDVEALYLDQLISAQDATTMLRALGYSPEEAAWLLQMQDVKRAVRAVTAAIGRIQSLYVAHKIDKTTAVGALDALRVPSAQRDDLLATWDIERGANIKVLTATEIASAYFYAIIDQGTATGELMDIGYTERDAWILLSVRKHNPQPNPPAGVTVPPRAS
jgi:hypothetical protein